MQVLLFCLAFVCLVQSVEYDGNAAGGFNLFTWYGDEQVTTCDRGEETVAGGVSSGTDLTFNKCYKTSDFGLDGDYSDEDDDTYFKVSASSDYGKFTISVYKTVTCSGDKLWSIPDLSESFCGCEKNIFGGCLSITVPRWAASLFDQDSCTGNPDELEKGLLKNFCYDGTDSGVGHYMLWTFQCGDAFTCGRYEPRTGVRHQLVFQCSNTCDTTKCKNTWTVRPTDCKCDGAGCILADFTTPAGTATISLYLVFFAVLAALMH